jgi:RNase P subunit RPR2
MTIKVIRRGHLPQNDQFDATCRKCHSEIQFLRSDGRFTSDQRDGDFLTVDCPVCGDPIHVDAKKGKPPVPPIGK